MRANLTAAFSGGLRNSRATRPDVDDTAAAAATVARGSSV